MELKGLDLFFWALGLTGHCVLLAVLWIRHRAGKFPVFTTLITANILRTASLYGTHRYGSGDDYFYAYWGFAFLDTVLQLALIYELSRGIFRPLGPWAADVRRSFIMLAGASLGVAALLTWLATPPTRTLRLAVVIRGSFFSSALMGELFVIMLALSVTMGFPWRTHVARIMQGFGIFSIFCVLTEGAHTYFGSDQSKDTFALVSYVRMTLYCLCLAYWSWELAKDEPGPRKLPEHLRLELGDLQRRAAMMLRGFREVGRA